jgi:hypothetical protein
MAAGPSAQDSVFRWRGSDRHCSNSSNTGHRPAPSRATTPYRPSARSAPATNGCKNPAQQRRLRSLAGRRQYLVRTRRGDLNPVKMINSRSKLFATDGSSINTSQARRFRHGHRAFHRSGPMGRRDIRDAASLVASYLARRLPARSYSPLEGGFGLPAESGPPVSRSSSGTAGSAIERHCLRSISCL